MNARGLLDQLMQQAQGLMAGQNGQHAPGSTQDSNRTAPHASATTGNPLAGALSSLGGMSSAGGLSSLLGGFGGGALSGGALGLLLGNKQFRKVGANVAMAGGVAALGVVAYRAFENWQRQQGQHQAPAPQTLDRVSPQEAESHSFAVLTALIAAAKSDGHIGDDERQLIMGELSKLSTDASDRRWLEAELARPLDVLAVAREAKSPEIAAEMYLASLLMVNEESPLERDYLNALSTAMKLDAGLKAELENQAKTVQVPA